MAIGNDKGIYFYLAHPLQASKPSREKRTQQAEHGRMENAGSAAHRRWHTSSSSLYSFKTSASSDAEITGGDETEASPPALESRVFVAVPEDVKRGKSTLLWALENLAKDGYASGLAIAHVHWPVQMIPIMGVEVHYTKVNSKKVNDHRKKVRAEAEEKLNEYVEICTRQKVSCEKIIIDNEDIAKGLEELIALHGITRLVMGAAADRHHTKNMKSLKSRTALRLTEAPASCKIWFTCKGHLICTREANTTVPAIPPPPAFTVASESSVTSVGSRPMAFSHSESGASISNGCPRHDLIRAELYMASVLEKVNELYQREIRRRKTIEETLARQAQEIEEMKRQHEATSNELHDVKEQKSVLKQQIALMASSVKDYQEKMAANEHLTRMLQADNEKLQQERDAGVTEAEVVGPLIEAASLGAGGRLSSFPPSASLDDAHTPSYFVCPIFQEVMSDPHIAADGFTYEAEAITGWFDSGRDTSPMTNLKLDRCELTPNMALRSAILEWQQQQQRR